MNRVFGLETEYGITVVGSDALDVVAESIELVRSYTEHGAHMKWDYALEDPHQDARGFRARELLQDTDESAYYEIDKSRPLSFEEIKTDLVLSNGARFYNDHAHPEYSTAECATIHEIVAHDKAGERIVGECARRRNAKLPPGHELRIYKNNTDFAGHSYGCHDNYLIDRAVPWDRLVAGIVPFLITRQIFAGAGKLGIEAEASPGTPGVYQISQRADFFAVLASIDTMNRRPLVNTRDEPHAAPDRYRRFHVIVGDANMSEWATAMKMATTALALATIERRQQPRLEIAHPIETNRAISRDQSHRWIMELADGRKISAIDVQRQYLEAAAKLDDLNEDDKWVLREWEQILNDLDGDISRTSNRIDWAAKKMLLEAMQAEEKLSWNDPWLQALDLEYHSVDPEKGLYYELVRQGSMRRVVTEEQIRHAIFEPPTTTRGFFRGRAVARFNEHIESIQWDEIVFADSAGRYRVTLPEPSVRNTRQAAMNAAIAEAKDFPDFLARIREMEL